MVYRTADGFGVTYSRSSGASSSTIGKPPPDESSASAYIVALLGAPDPAGDGRGVICGLVTSAVSRVAVELRDGGTVSAETRELPGALDTDLRTFLLRPRSDGRPLGPGEPPSIRTFSCLASDGLVLERRGLHPRAGSG